MTPVFKLEFGPRHESDAHLKLD